MNPVVPPADDLWRSDRRGGGGAQVGQDLRWHKRFTSTVVQRSKEDVCRGQNVGELTERLEIDEVDVWVGDEFGSVLERIDAGASCHDHHIGVAVCRDHQRKRGNLFRSMFKPHATAVENSLTLRMKTLVGGPLVHAMPIGEVSERRPVGQHRYVGFAILAVLGSELSEAVGDSDDAVGRACDAPFERGDHFARHAARAGNCRQVGLQLLKPQHNVLSTGLCRALDYDRGGHGDLAKNHGGRGGHVSNQLRHRPPELLLVAELTSKLRLIYWPTEIDVVDRYAVVGCV